MLREGEHVLLRRVVGVVPAQRLKGKEILVWCMVDPRGDTRENVNPEGHAWRGKFTQGEGASRGPREERNQGYPGETYARVDPNVSGDTRQRCVQGTSDKKATRGETKDETAALDSTQASDDAGPTCAADSCRETTLNAPSVKQARDLDEVIIVDVFSRKLCHGVADGLGGGDEVVGACLDLLRRQVPAQPQPGARRRRGLRRRRR